MTINYTRSGDGGTTGVMGKGRISKDSSIVYALGDVDELNSVIGIAISSTPDERITRMLRVIQDKLFTVGAELSSSVEGGGRLKTAITGNDVRDMEKEMDELSSRLPDLKQFILPGGSAAGSYLHFARAVARRAERSVIAFDVLSPVKVNPFVKSYLNRLSSFLFVAARHMNRKEGIEEDNPTYQ